MSDESLSKTQLKKQMHELQELGAELVDLNEQQLATIDLPESLLDAVMAARRITKFEARRRQLQYIGKLMRSIDPEPIRERIDAYKAVSHKHTARLHLVERWRTRLLEDEHALTQLLNEYPHADATQLRLLVRNTLREREAGDPPKSFRALFQLLNDVVGTREKIGDMRGEEIGHTREE
jgi:ribosome-associated protein